MKRVVVRARAPENCDEAPKVGTADLSEKTLYDCPSQSESQEVAKKTEFGAETSPQIVRPQVGRPVPSPKMVIDYRERALIQALRAAGIQFDTANLPVGDISFVIGDRMCLIIERKTWSDLCSSIQDGRFREQKARLRASGATLIWYLIERSECWSKMSKNVLEGAILNLLVRDRLQVLQTDGPSDTFRMVQKTYDKVVEHAEDLAAAVPHFRSYEESVSVSIQKSDNYTPQLCFLAQLRQIHGVSDKIAEGLADHWESMSALVVDLHRMMPEASIRMLSTVKTKSGRNIGESVAKKIYHSLFPMGSNKVPD
ncbi:MAG: crossover junction endonuclease [Sulfobacillus sp.]